MKFWISPLAFVLLVIAAGCGSSPSSSSSIFNPPPVQAQVGYSNASINGTYSFSLSIGDANVVVGSFKADGNGNITGGKYTSNNAVQCSVSISGGNYTVNPDASGTLQIIFVNPTANECPSGAAAMNTTKFNVSVAQHGESIFIAGIDERYAGSAAKQ